jgi:phage terminase small subunit
MAGRRSYTTIDAVQFGTPSSPSLGPAERLAFLDLVSRTPITQFEPSDLPLILRWCELCVMAEQAAAHLAAEGAVVNGKQNPWFAVHQQATKGLLGLSLRLRLAPQSRAFKAPKTRAAAMSFYDRTRLEGDDGQAEAGEAH